MKNRITFCPPIFLLLLPFALTLGHAADSLDEREQIRSMDKALELFQAELEEIQEDWLEARYKNMAQVKAAALGDLANLADERERINALRPWLDRDEQDALEEAYAELEEFKLFIRENLVDADLLSRAEWRDLRHNARQKVAKLIEQVGDLEKSGQARP